MMLSMRVKNEEREQNPVYAQFAGIGLRDRG